MVDESMYMLETSKKQSSPKWNMSMVLLCLYVLLTYIAQETLLPPVLHSMTMYAFIGWTALNVFRRGKVRLKKYTLWYLSVIAFSAISMLWAVEAETGTLYVMFVSLILTSCILETVDSLEKLEACMLTFVIAATVMGIMLFATGQVDVEGNERLGEEITGNANSFSILFMVSSMFASWFLVYKKGFVRTFSLLSLLFQFVIMGLSGGRKSVIVAVICLLWYILAKDLGRAKKLIKDLIKFALFFAMGYWVVMEVPVFYKTIGYRFENLFTLLLTGDGVTLGDKVRQEMVRIGLERWIWSPIWGYGLDTFKHYNEQITGHFYYAHNNYVELLYDLGIIGMVLYYSFFVRIFWGLKQMLPEYTQYRALGLGIVFSFLVYDLGGVTFYGVFYQIVICLAFFISTRGR